MADLSEIGLQHIGKKYKHWIFRNVDLNLVPGGRYAVVGRNGIGKSTLLKIIAGAVIPSEGQVIYTNQGKSIDLQEALTAISFAAPYVDLIEELTVMEMSRFHSRFRSLHKKLENCNEFLERINLRGHSENFVGDLSSGLMQRLRLGLALLFPTPVLLLDEPTSYLDSEGKQWYNRLLENYLDNQILVIASNDHDDLHYCKEEINIEKITTGL